MEVVQSLSVMSMLLLHSAVITLLSVLSVAVLIQDLSPVHMILFLYTLQTKER